MVDEASEGARVAIDIEFVVFIHCKVTAVATATQLDNANQYPKQ